MHLTQMRCFLSLYPGDVLLPEIQVLNLSSKKSIFMLPRHPAMLRLHLCLPARHLH